MKPTSIKSILRGDVSPGTEVRIQGWVRTKRGSRADFAFVNVHDGSCFDALQVVCEASALANFEADVSGLNSGASVDVVGTLAVSQGKGQSVELHATTFVLVGGVEDPDTYPMPQKRHTLEHLRANAHLRPRTNLIGAVMRVRNCLAQAIHRYFHQEGFFWIHTPIITANDAEGAGNMFHVSTLDLANLPRTEIGRAHV